MHRGKVHNGDGGSWRSESRGNAARSSTSNTMKNDRLFKRFVQLIGVSQIREIVMMPREPHGIKFAKFTRTKIFTIACRYGLILKCIYINFIIRRRIAWHCVECCYSFRRGRKVPVDSIGEISSGTSRGDISRHKNDRSFRSTSLALPVVVISAIARGEKEKFTWPWWKWPPHLHQRMTTSDKESSAGITVHFFIAKWNALHSSHRYCYYRIPPLNFRCINNRIISLYCRT